MSGWDWFFKMFVVNPTSDDYNVVTPRSKKLNLDLPRHHCDDSIFPFNYVGSSDYISSFSNVPTQVLLFKVKKVITVVEKEDKDCSKCNIDLKPIQSSFHFDSKFLLTILGLGKSSFCDFQCTTYFPSPERFLTPVVLRLTERNVEEHDDVGEKDCVDVSSTLPLEFVLDGTLSGISDVHQWVGVVLHKLQKPLIEKFFKLEQHL